MAMSTASSDVFARKPLPKRFCNLDRLLHALEARGLDGIVATLPNNVFYLTGFNGIAHKSDEPRVCAVILSAPCARSPDHGGRRLLPGDLPDPADLDRGHPAVPRRDDAARSAGHAQPTSTVSSRRPAGGTPWIENARQQYAFDMGQRAARARSRS